MHELKQQAAKRGTRDIFSASKAVFFQPKLAVNEPNDIYEQEADQTAERVMGMTDNKNTFFKPADSSIQRKCPSCEEEGKHVQRKEGNGEEMAGNNLDTYVGSLKASGSPLPENSRQFFEPKFGRDFSNVRLHTDGAAAKSAQSINALAYTAGNNIVFNERQYSPNSGEGQRLLAHELTHVVQQGKDTVRRYGHDKFCDPAKHLGPFIWPGHAEAVRMLTGVLSAFANNDARLQSIVPNLFGAAALSHMKEIEENYKKINAALNGNYIYHCNDEKNENPNPKKCYGQRMSTDIDGTKDVMVCFNTVNSRYDAKEVGALIIHENYHRALDDSIHPWQLKGDPPDCGDGAPTGTQLLLDNPESYACLAKAF